MSSIIAPRASLGKLRSTYAPRDDLRKEESNTVRSVLHTPKKFYKDFTSNDTNMHLLNTSGSNKSSSVKIHFYSYH